MAGGVTKYPPIQLGCLMISSLYRFGKLPLSGGMSKILGRLGDWHFHHFSGSGLRYLGGNSMLRLVGSASHLKN